MFLSGIAGLGMVVFVALAVTLLQPQSVPAEEELFFNQRALEEQVAESTPAIPGDYFDSRNLKETDPATMSKGGATVYGRPPSLEQVSPEQDSELQQEGFPEQGSQLEQEGSPEQGSTLEDATPAQTSELEQEEGDFEGDTLTEPDAHAHTSELALEDAPQQTRQQLHENRHGALRAEVSKLASGQDRIEKELHTLENVLVKNARAARPAPIVAASAPAETQTEAAPAHRVPEPQLAISGSETSDATDDMPAVPQEARPTESKSGMLHYGQKILIRTHHGHFVASRTSGQVMTLAHKHAAATFTILNYDDPTDSSPVRFGDVVGLQDKGAKYLEGDLDGRLEAKQKGLSRQDAFVLTDPHNHDDVSHVKTTQPISLFSVHFGKFMAVDGDEELMVHGDSDNENAQFAMLAQ